MDDAHPDGWWDKGKGIELMKSERKARNSPVSTCRDKDVKREISSHRSETVLFVYFFISFHEPWHYNRIDDRDLIVHGRWMCSSQVPIGKCFYGRDVGDLPAGGGEGNRIHHISDVMVRDARDKVGGGWERAQQCNAPPRIAIFQLLSYCCYCYVVTWTLLLTTLVRCSMVNRAEKRWTLNNGNGKFLLERFFLDSWSVNSRIGWQSDLINLRNANGNLNVLAMECGWVYNNGHLSDAPSVCVCVYIILPAPIT